MDQDDVADLMAYWRHAPPEGLRARPPAEADAPPGEPPSPEQLQRILEGFNARFSGRIARA